MSQIDATFVPMPAVRLTTAAGAGSCKVAMRPRDEDDELLARVAAGDAAAFRRLMDRHVDTAYRLARRVTGSHAEAEDAVQEAFLRVWARAGGWRPGGARFPTWLWRVTLNLCLDARRRPQTAPLSSVSDPADPAADAADAMIERQRDERLERATASLPGRQRAALALVYATGASNAEAAEALQISVGALEQLLVRAKRALREQLGNG